MSAEPKISVVIPTYNRMRTLPRAIASVLAQEDAPDFELIVVNDASTDDTAAYLTSLTDPRLRVITAERNVGSGGARNLGIEAARADIIAFLDSDDAYLARRLSAPLAVFAAEPDVVCTLSSALKRGEKDRVAVLPHIKLSPTGFRWGLICDLFGVEGSSITVRRRPAVRIGGFCTGLDQHDDREFLIRLADHGAARFIPDILWEKWYSPDGLSENRAEYGRGLIDYVRARPEYVGAHRKVGAYMATRALVADLRAGMLSTFWRDIRAFRAAGLINGDPLGLWRNHREVRRYRRQLWNRQELAALAGPPEGWMEPLHRS